jgi:hypothetical protein
MHLMRVAVPPRGVKNCRTRILHGQCSKMHHQGVYVYTLLISTPPWYRACHGMCTHMALDLGLIQTAAASPLLQLSLISPLLLFL